MIGQGQQDRPTRRRFLRRAVRLGLGVAGILGGLTAMTRIRPGRNIAHGMRRDLGLLRPPGALSEQEFLGACIRCTRCADACSVSAIQFLGPEAGSLGGTPCIDPIRQACEMCLSCGNACPTGALQPLSDRQHISVGTAVVDDRLCVSINGTGVCGACYTACPLRGSAITQDIRNAPRVHAEYCTGCGLCEQFCIVDDRDGLRAIQVRSTRRYVTA